MSESTGPLPTNHSAPLLAAHGLSRVADGRTLLDGVSLELYAGERVAILGPTGSGKSVLLRALVLLDPLSTGEVFWHGQRVTAAEIPRFRSRIVYLQQRPALSEGLVEGILREPFALAAHRDRSFDRAGIVARLTTLGRDASFLAKLGRDLSGGEAQIVALLRAMQLAPEVLLLDEPTAALDADSTAQVETLVDGWLAEAATQRACVWVTHDRVQADRVAQRIVQLRGGSIVGE
ncbi:MAG: ATP-binding cassette domain-containing protein [Planctomycetales bacterium]|nr:ATP-binding cassette domain-containing protein [Planctomycetales bacterium]